MFNILRTTVLISVMLALSSCGVVLHFLDSTFFSRESVITVGIDPDFQMTSSTLTAEEMLRECSPALRLRLENHTYSLIREEIFSNQITYRVRSARKVEKLVGIIENQGVFRMMLVDEPQLLSLKNKTGFTDSEGHNRFLMKTRPSIALMNNAAWYPVRQPRHEKNDRLSWLPLVPVGLDGRSVKTARAGEDDYRRPKVIFQLTGQGSAVFTDITSRYNNYRLAIVLNNQIISSPYIRSPITGGAGEITGEFTREEVAYIVNTMTAQPLPYPLKVLDFWTISNQ